MNTTTSATVHEVARTMAGQMIGKLSSFVVKLVLDFMPGRVGEITNLPISPSPSMVHRQRVTFDSEGIEYTIDFIAKRKV
jgi:hypothetical protein